MNAIIIGATSIGGVLAKYLVEEGHDVHVIDSDGEAIAQLQSRVDVRALQCHPEDPDALREAHIHSADMVLAVTHSDSRNIVTTLGLHSLAPQARAALWVRDVQFTDNVHIWKSPQLKGCIQLTPEKNALSLVMDLLEIPLAFEAASFLGGRIHIAGFRLQDDSHLIGGRLSDIVENADRRTLVVAVERDDQLIIPHGEFVFKARDRLYLPLMAGHTLSDAFLFIGLEQSLLRMRNTHYLIGGGGIMGLHLARQLEQKGLRVTLVEKDQQRGMALAEMLTKTQVLRGDVTDPAFLQESIGTATTYISLTGNQEINFLSAVLARRLGAERAITMFDNEGYIAISALMGVDATVHPNLTVIGQVIGLLRPCDVVEAQLMMGGKLEAVLIRLEPTSPLVGKSLHAAGFPDGAIVATVVRDDQLLLPDGHTVLRAEDKILLVTNRQEKIKRTIRRLFQPG